MTLSANVLGTFLKDFERLKGLSARSTSHEIGEAVGIVRKFIWKDDNLDKLRSAIGGYSNKCTIETETLDPKVTIGASTLARYKVLIPYLAVLPSLGPIRTYTAVEYARGNPVDLVQGAVPREMDLDTYRTEPFVVVDGLWISRGDLVSYFAYEVGHLHWELTIPDKVRAQKIKDAGKLTFAAGLIGDLSFAWTGNSNWQPAQLQERLQLSTDHEINTLLLLQIIFEILHSASVAEMVVDATKLTKVK
jgi:hypothetical protein